MYSVLIFTIKESVIRFFALVNNENPEEFSFLKNHSYQELNTAIAYSLWLILDGLANTPDD